MANYRKSFNFRNGVQVDDDNLVVNANGLVGIGTTVPTEILDVRGTAKVVGLITSTELFVTGVSTFSDVRIGTGITIDASSGIITATKVFGDGSTLSNLPTSQWVDIDVGLGFTSIYAQGHVGVGTTDPRNAFQVGGDPYNSGNGVGFSSITGDIRTSGILTASSFVGSGAGVTSINADNISSGTISNDRIPTLENSKIPSNVSVSGIITASGGFSGNVTGDITGDLTGTATAASSLTGTPNITVGIVTATRVIADSVEVPNTGITTVLKLLHVGTGGTAFAALDTGRIGIGTAIPTAELQIRRTSGSLLEVISDVGQSRISVGQSVGAGNSSGLLRFGNSNKTLDLVNLDTGNLNMILHGGTSGVGTGRFDWIYGQNITSPLMSLTYKGNFGIGLTNPSNNLHVVGTSTVTSTAFFGGDVRAKKIYFTELVDGVVKTNANITSGISTFNRIYANGGDNIVAIGTDSPGAYKFNIADGLDAYLGTRVVVGVGNTADSNFFASNLDADASEMKVFANSYVGSNFYVRSAATVGSGSTTVEVGAGIVTATDGFTSGTGTPVQISVSGSTLTFTVGGLSTSLTLS